MLIYLTSNESVNLLDFVENEVGLTPKKLTGNFSLMQFVVRDMRNFGHIKYLCINRKAITEDDGAFIEAIHSFKLMYNARIIVLCEGLDRRDALFRELLTAEVTDIVIATEIEGIRSEILECLSPQGMEKYKLKESERSVVAHLAKDENVLEQYKFGAKNIRIAIVGSQRRVGVTVTAVNLTSWINAHGGSACYLESNTNKHLSYILKLYDAEQKGNAYALNGTDFYFTDEIKKDYNFIITDCGEFATLHMQDKFKGADLRLLCCSAMPYELPHFQNAVNLCKNLDVKVLGMFVTEDMRELCQTSICENMLFADSSHELFSNTANDRLYRDLMGKYISG